MAVSTAYNVGLSIWMQIYGKVLFNKATIFSNFDNYFPGVFFTVLHSK